MTNELAAQLLERRNGALVNPDGSEAYRTIEAQAKRIAELEVGNLRLTHALTAISDNWVANTIEEGDEYSEGFDDGLHDAAIVAKEALAGGGDE